MFKPATLFFFLFYFSFPSSNFSQTQWSLTELNLAHQYDPNAEIWITGDPQIKSDSLYLNFELILAQDKPTLNDYSFEIFLLEKLDDRLKESVDETKVSITQLYALKNEYGFRLATKATQANWLILKTYSNFSGYSFYFEFPLNAFNTPPISLTKNNIPIIKAYASTGNIESKEALVAYYYGQPFEHAAPPMFTDSQLPSKELMIDSVFQVNANATLNSPGEGLYFFQLDSTKSVGKGLFIGHSYYPKPVTLEHLKAPLVYLTSRNEKKQIEAIREKRAFDSFWLELTDSPNRAKKLIKSYYSRVEEANWFFTTYKQGWETDMGMIYIIFGPPQEVIKSSVGETWVYLANNNFPKLKFKFIRVQNVFSSSHYALIRDKKYDMIWFKAIDLWRKGRF